MGQRAQEPSSSGIQAMAHSHKAPHCGNKLRVCEVNFPCADGSLSGESITRRRPVKEHKESNSPETKSSLTSPRLPLDYAEAT